MVKINARTIAESVADILGYVLKVLTKNSRALPRKNFS